MTRMNILVPTDFSPQSRYAVNYAIRLASTLDADINLLHVVHLESKSNSPSLRADLVEKVVMENVNSESSAFLSDLGIQNPGLAFRFEILRGYPLERVVEHHALTRQMDLLVIGSKGATGLKKVLIGTSAAAIIGHSSIPVLTVPDKAQFRGIRNLLYASTLENLGKELPPLVALAKLIGAHVQILHVTPQERPTSSILETIEKLKEKLGYSDLSLEVVEGQDYLNTIDHYLSETRADLLAMFTHEPTTYEKIFGKSLTREMSFHTMVPLLTMKT